MLMGSHSVEWCDSVNYLGVYLVSSSDITFDINPVKRFYAACCTVWHTKWCLDPSSRLATMDMGRKLGGCAPLGGAGSPSNTM